MATTKKTAAQPAKNTKPVAAAKKAAPAAKKPVVINEKAPAKKVAAKAPVKKAVAAKPAAPKKETPSKTEAKNTVATKTPAKGAEKPVAASINKEKTVSKNEIKPVAPAKKGVPEKKATPEKTPAGKKEAPAAKKAAPAKPEPKAPVSKAAAKEEKPQPKPAPKAEVKEAPAPEHRAPAAKKAVVKKKTLTLSQIPVKPGTPLPKPTPAPSVRPADKKPTVIIAHRRMENKSKVKTDAENIASSYPQENYRSILDEPQQQPQGPIYRYSDEDLTEFREIINSRLDAARKELNYLQGLITRKDEAGTDDTENRHMNVEDGSGAMEREQVAQLASRQIQFMGHLEKALVRIENKTYGICRVTGKLIDKARLRAVPHATLSIEAKNMMGSKNN